MIMHEYLVTHLRNGDDIDHLLIEHYESKAKFVLEPFKNDLIQTNQTVILKIFKTSQDACRAEIDLTMIRTQHLLDSVSHSFEQNPL